MTKHKKIPPRERILEKAFELFHTKGYNSTGINQIIGEAEVSKATLYDHFKSKEELCVEYLNKRHAYWFDKLNTYVGKHKSSRNKILAAFDFIAEMNQEEDFRGCSFLNIVSEITADNKLILKVIQNHKQDLRNLFAGLLSPGQTDKSDHLYLLFESAIVESQLFRNQWPVKTAKNIAENELSKKSKEA